ncbi:MAG: SIMPL domain-containing protein [Patescibacteria group bacterium]|nr:SIMPL domain-containing protein [Patescibacteria group bacterium]
MEDTTKSKPLIAFGAILGISLIVTAIIVSWVVYYVKTYNNAVITVTGVAEKQVTSDVVKWHATIARQTGSTSADLKQGSAEMQSDLSALLSYFGTNGVTSSEITVDPLSVTPMYQSQYGVYPGKVGYSSGDTLAGYSLSQNILIQSGNVSGVTALAQKAPQYFLNKGIVFSSQPLEYYLSNILLDSIRQQMLAEALANAKDRANAITNGVGASVGNLRSSSVGVTQVTPVNSTEISGSGYYDTTSIDKLVTYLVHTTFTMR